MRKHSIQSGRRAAVSDKRKGGVLVLAAGLLVLVFAFAAFTVDLGFITVTKAQAQNAADAAAHAAVLELQSGFAAGAQLTSSAARSNAETAAKAVVNSHRTGDLASTPLDINEDLRFGRRLWDSTNSRWTTAWDTAPYNVVEVRVRRARENQTSLPLAFARVIGSDDAEVAATAVAAIMPGVGFGPPSGNPNDPGDTADTVNILPFTVDLGTWNAFMQAYTSGSFAAAPATSFGQAYASLAAPGNGNGNGNGNDAEPVFVDQYHYNHSTGQVEPGGDGIPELNIYPDLNSSLPSGNRGTVDLGAPNNSTNDLKRQIEFGLNAYDFSFFPNHEIRLDRGPMYLNGDTGISAGINGSLLKIVGRSSAIPIFISVSGPGNNAEYTIVKFVGVRVMASKLSGGPNKRHLYVEPAPFYDPHVIRADTDFSMDSIMTSPVLVRE